MNLDILNFGYPDLGQYMTFNYWINLNCKNNLFLHWDGLFPYEYVIEGLNCLFIIQKKNHVDWWQI